MKIVDERQMPKKPQKQANRNRKEQGDKSYSKRVKPK